MPTCGSTRGRCSVAKTYFFWDDLEDNIIEEYDDAGVTIADYTTEPDHFGNVISQRRDGQSSFFHYDALGSTLAVTDESQSVTDTRAYSAFGETTESTGNTTFPLQYVGENGYYKSALTGELLIRRRLYAPVLARWISIDTLAKVLSTSAYVYANNCPPVYVDPPGTGPILGIDVSGALGEIQETIEELVDAEVQNAVDQVQGNATGILKVAALASGYNLCFKLDVGLKGASVVGTGSAFGPNLNWQKRAFCTALGWAAGALAQSYVTPALAPKFPITAESGCSMGCKCDEMWQGKQFTFPPVSYPLGQVSFPFGHPGRAGWCSVALALNMTVTVAGFSASCVTIQADNQ